ncbi:MAG TPA: fatty acid desaturase [Polyangiaceae bacterium]|nr:fatty acid desaturase [Polyangiaceae bacterium]
MLFSPEQLKELRERSDAKGVLRLAIHLTAIAAGAWLYAVSIQRGAPVWLTLLLAVAFGFTLVTMFAAMHESIHRTAFESRWLNDSVGWFAGLLSFYNSTFYRYYHGWHHRFTQIPGKDPELDDKKPTRFSSYLLEMSGAPWWIGKLKTHFAIAAGRVESFPFLSEQNRSEVVRSVRLQLSVYGLAIAASIALREPWFVTFWLLPVALAQPLLRAILLAEHTGCTSGEDPLSNTRTTHTVLPVRLLMWDMPYHAEHHHYPALPFFALRAAHERMGPELAHVERRGYLGFHVAFLRDLWARPRAGQVS